MIFARSIGDPNRIYFDEEYAAGSALGQLIAPPTFTVSGAHFDMDFPFRPHPDSMSSCEGSDVHQTAHQSRSGLHAEQHFEYRRPIAPGEVLFVRVRRGRAWARRGRRGGRLSFTETITEYSVESGEVVVSSRCVLVHTSHSPGVE